MFWYSSWLLCGTRKYLKQDSNLLRFSATAPADSLHIIFSLSGHNDTSVQSPKTEVTDLFGTENYFLVQIHAKGYTSEIKFAKFVFNYVIINKD